MSLVPGVGDIDIMVASELLEAGRGMLRLMTLAPEADGALAAIGMLTAAGVLVSVGHSDATAAEVAAGAAAPVPPGEALRVLMVIARPEGLEDVGYRMIARPVMERLAAETETRSPSG